ncbi:MAG: hypothetical protein ATN31_02370 [Candidatus Epulonipiscioides saccharophilum]|nr:MAG: hypothetical protein ATN31_02370 [Epulopiscium sp. AS2M-Bin001]
MVTIEQKLALFSKLMQQDISDNLQAGRAQIEKDYRTKRVQQEQNSREHANKYVNDHKKAIDMKVSQYVAKAKLDSKKIIMQAKADCIDMINDMLKDKIIAYTKTKEYDESLKDQLLSLQKYFTDNDNVTIFLSPDDLTTQKELLLKSLASNGISAEKIEFGSSDHVTLGGLILKVKDIQIDLSLDSLLENKSDYISQLILTTIEKECEKLEK